jgi:quercetin dioxygenase-like cupin family protein
MSLNHHTILLIAGLGLATVTPAFAQEPAAAPDAMRAVAASSVAWGDAAIPGFAPGMKLAVIDGDPNAAGPYTVRLSFPDGYRFPPHFHPGTENVTVLTGVLQLGMGEQTDDSKLKSYGPGDYLYIPSPMPHFGGAKGYTVVQLHGQGPFAINLVNKPTM